MGDLIFGIGTYKIFTEISEKCEAKYDSIYGNIRMLQ